MRELTIFRVVKQCNECKLFHLICVCLWHTTICVSACYFDPLSSSPTLLLHLFFFSACVCVWVGMKKFISAALVGLNLMMLLLWTIIYFSLSISLAVRSIVCLFVCLSFGQSVACFWCLVCDMRCAMCNAMCMYEWLSFGVSATKIGVRLSKPYINKQTHNRSNSKRERERDDC